ncbi:MAG: hypothetical protein Ct9H90mP10_10480 [Actinomycetota bacterium]|nr:MAG: hypothetical protein Ct9H90mP10_10480 [Actinomycetota bacterium]
MSFEQWYESVHGEYMKGFSSNIFNNLDKNLNLDWDHKSKK